MNKTNKNYIFTAPPSLHFQNAAETTLESVINCNLTRLARLLRILRFHAHDLNLQPSSTEYMRQGKGPKLLLRFTKAGNQKLEKAYATHFIWPGKGPFRAPACHSQNYKN